MCIRDSSDEDGNNSKEFFHFIGGLQTYLPDAMLLFAPYVNSYRRFVIDASAPINTHWGIENRTVAFRVPTSQNRSRRIENRIPVSVRRSRGKDIDAACGQLANKY